MVNALAKAGVDLGENGSVMRYRHDCRCHAMRLRILSRCRRGRAYVCGGYVCGGYVCDCCGGAGVTLNTTIQAQAETKRHREGDTSALEQGGTQEVHPCVQMGAGHLHKLAEVLVRVAQSLAEVVLVKVAQSLAEVQLPWRRTFPAVAY